MLCLLAAAPGVEVLDALPEDQSADVGLEAGDRAGQNPKDVRVRAFGSLDKAHLHVRGHGRFPGNLGDELAMQRPVAARSARPAVFGWREHLSLAIEQPEEREVA